MKETMMEWDLGEILKSCNFPYPCHFYFQDESIEKAENAILENKVLILAIHEEYEKKIREFEPSGWNHMYSAACIVLTQWGKEHPDFLKQYEDIKSIVYKKYKETVEKSL